MVNCTTARFFLSKSTVSREGKLHRKAATEKQREGTSDGGWVAEETVFASRSFASMPQVIHHCCLCRGNSSLTEYGSFTQTSLCFTELQLLRSLLIRCGNTNVRIHICTYECANLCTPTDFLTVTY